METEKLKLLYDKAVTEYIRTFEEKQEMELEFWVSDDVGGVASFGDEMIYSFDDIRLDINHEAPKGLIIDWMSDNIEAGHENYINYYSYIKGLRHDQIQNQ